MIDLSHVGEKRIWWFQKSLLRYDIYKPGKQYTKLKWFSGLSWKHQRTTYIKVHQKVRKMRPAQRCFFFWNVDSQIKKSCIRVLHLVQWNCLDSFLIISVDIHTSSLFLGGTSKKRCERSIFFIFPSAFNASVANSKAFSPSRKALFERGFFHGFFNSFRGINTTQIYAKFEGFPENHSAIVHEVSVGNTHGKWTAGTWKIIQLEK